MSKFVKVQTTLQEFDEIRAALGDLKIPFEEDAEYRHRWSKRREVVPLLVREDSLCFGLRLNDKGIYEAIGDDMDMKRIRDVLERVAQRYAYRKVLAETERAGFDLIEERTDDNQVIRLTVRRWR